MPGGVERAGASRTLHNVYRLPDAGYYLACREAGYASEGKQIHLQEVGCLISNYQCTRWFCMIGWLTIL